MNIPAYNQLLRHVSLRQLQVFDTIARLGSFTGAAKELFLTQPTVSMQIKTLEAGIGLPLFEQIGKQIYLTDAGKMVHEHARQVLDAFANLHMDIADMHGLKTGTLRLAVVTTAKYFVPQALGRFCERYSGVDVALNVINRESLLERMTENLDDLYIMGHPPQTSEYIFEPYLDNLLVVLAPSTHPLAGVRGIEPEQLVQYPFILRESGSGTRMAVDEFFSRRGIQIKIRMELGSNETVKQAVSANLGISVLSRHTLSADGEKEGLVILDVKGFPIPWHWYVGHYKGKRLSVVAKSFLDLLRNEAESIRV